MPGMAMPSTRSRATSGTPSTYIPVPWCSVLKWPSNAASFAGWLCATARACSWPLIRIATLATAAISSPTRKPRLASSSCRRLSRYQAQMLVTKNAPWMKLPSRTWTRRCMLDGLNTIAQKSVISARALAPCPTMWKPAGVCCQEFAITIQVAENTDPKNTMQVAKKCMRRDTRSQPNTSSDKKPDSRKNAKMPSAASADPNTSPTKREYVAQFVPNSNSITMPVATPTAKFTANSFVQKRASAS